MASAYDLAMVRTRVKVCGITRLADAQAAARLGADAIGMVFYEGTGRYVDRDRARQIMTALPPFVTPVGLFVDEPPQVILDLTAELNLRTVQLNGEESPEEIAELSGLTVIKAIHVQRDQISAELRRWKTAIDRLNLKHLSGLVLETANTGQPGGSGVANDWGAIRELQSRGEFDGLPPLIAAGGLKPQTVGDVVRNIRPYAVDVSSGVESARGEKDEKKIAEFINAVREADDAHS
jgi:phosphoribosylanthranilate isomerase